MAQYGFHFDSSRCTGCKTCELVCKDYHDLGPAILFRRIYDYEGGTWTKTKEDAWEKTAFNYHVSISCNHCDSPACVENCPTGAMQKDEATGLVNTDANVWRGRSRWNATFNDWRFAAIGGISTGEELPD